MSVNGSKYYIAPMGYNGETRPILCDTDASIVPALLRYVETRKGRPYWTDRASWAAAYQSMTKQQWMWLMDASEYIARALFYQMGYARDVALAADGFPAVELPEATLIDIRKHIGDPGDGTLYSKLTEVANALAAEGPNGELLGELLQELALLLLI